VIDRTTNNAQMSRRLHLWSRAFLLKRVTISLQTNN